MKSMRHIANNIAETLTAPGLYPEDTKPAHVCLDAVGATDDDGAPIVVVVPVEETGRQREDRKTSIDVAVIIDATQYTGNAATPGTDGTSQVLQVGAGDVLEGIVDRVIEKLQSANVGAILSGVDVDYSYTTIPAQYATIHLTYTQIRAYEITTF